VAIKYFKWSKNIPTFPVPRPSKIYPNWDFWFENRPSGNPVGWYIALSKAYRKLITPVSTIVEPSRWWHHDPIGTDCKKANRDQNNDFGNIFAEKWV
jgi:hypothetical protein